MAAARSPKSRTCFQPIADCAARLRRRSPLLVSSRSTRLGRSSPLRPVCRSAGSQGPMVNVWVMVAVTTVVAGQDLPRRCRSYSDLLQSETITTTMHRTAKSADFGPWQDAILDPAAPLPPQHPGTKLGRKPPWAFLKGDRQPEKVAEPSLQYDESRLRLRPPSYLTFMTSLADPSDADSHPVSAGVNVTPIDNHTEDGSLPSVEEQHSDAMEIQSNNDADLVPNDDEPVRQPSGPRLWPVSADPAFSTPCTFLGPERRLSMLRPQSVSAPAVRLEVNITDTLHSSLPESNSSEPSATSSVAEPSAEVRPVTSSRAASSTVVVAELPLLDQTPSFVSAADENAIDSDAVSSTVIAETLPLNQTPSCVPSADEDAIYSEAASSTVDVEPPLLLDQTPSCVSIADEDAIESEAAVEDSNKPPTTSEKGSTRRSLTPQQVAVFVVLEVIVVICLVSCMGAFVFVGMKSIWKRPDPVRSSPSTFTYVTPTGKTTITVPIYEF